MVPLLGPDDPPLTPDCILLIYERILRAILAGLLVALVAFLILRLPEPPGPVEGVTLTVTDLAVASSYWRDDGLASHEPLWEARLVKVNVSSARDAPLMTRELMFDIEYEGVTFQELPHEHALADARFPEGELKRDSPYVRPHGWVEGWVVFLVPPGLPPPADGLVSVRMRHSSGAEGPEADFYLPNARDAGPPPARLSVRFANVSSTYDIGPYEAAKGTSFVLCDFEVGNLWSGPVEFTLFEFCMLERDGSLTRPHYVTHWVNGWDAHVVVAPGANVTITVVFQSVWTSGRAYVLEDEVPVVAWGTPRRVY